jgi:hypothetical protein
MCVPGLHYVQKINAALSDPDSESYANAAVLVRAAKGLSKSLKALALMAVRTKVVTDIETIGLDEATAILAMLSHEQQRHVIEVMGRAFDEGRAIQFCWTEAETPTALVAADNSAGVLIDVRTPHPAPVFPAGAFPAAYVGLPGA